MEYLFKESQIDDEHTFFIIGNGFDLAHKIRSRYYDFQEWCEINGLKELVNLMEIFFNNTEEDVWANIESALGNYDEDSIIEYCKSNSEFDYDHPNRSIAEIEDAPNDIFKPVLDLFKERFEEWVNSIDISTAKQLSMYFPRCSKYLTFNYTETLERIYRIPNENVLHIHGSRLTNKKYIIGHNNKVDPRSAFQDDAGMPFMQETKEKIIIWMNDFAKQSDLIIKKESIFFSSLKNINHVIVIGHSLNEIDYPYLREVVKQCGANVLWSIYYHNNDDLKRIDKFVEAMHLLNVNRIFM